MLIRVIFTGHFAFTRARLTCVVNMAYMLGVLPIAQTPSGCLRLGSSVVADASKTPTGAMVCKGEILIAPGLA